MNSCPHPKGKLNSNAKCFTATPNSKKIKGWPSNRISRVFYLKDTNRKKGAEWNYLSKAIQDTLIDDKAAPSTVGITQFNTPT